LPSASVPTLPPLRRIDQPDTRLAPSHQVKMFLKTPIAARLAPKADPAQAERA
jgi:hypothetical protein